MDNDTDKYYTDNSNDRPYWIAENILTIKIKIDLIIIN